jgi:hypothetical protein
MKFLPCFVCFLIIVAGIVGQPVHRLEGRDPSLERLHQFRAVATQFLGGNLVAFLPQVFPSFE